MQINEYLNPFNLTEKVGWFQIFLFYVRYPDF
jgi:hypothetical protein